MFDDAFKTGDLDAISKVISISCYSAIHYIIKASIFIIIGLILKELIPVFGVVGIVGGLIYLLVAIRNVPHLAYYRKRLESNTDQADA
jgi:hypothetical protein